MLRDEQKQDVAMWPRGGSSGDRGRRPSSIVAILAIAALVIAVPAAAQDEGTGGGGYPEGGYPEGDPGGGDADGGGYDGGGAAASGRVELELTAKKKQRSLKAVKAKATCRNRSCMVDAKGKLKAGKKRAKLKPAEGVAVGAGDTEKLKLKLGKKAKRTAKRAARDDLRSKVTIRARASGVGGGGSDKAKVAIKLKRKR